VGDPEVGQARLAIRREKDVPGSDVSMDDPGGMGGRQGGGDIPDDPNSLLRRERRSALRLAREALRERGTRNVVEDEGGLAFADVEVADADDVWLVERLERFELATEPRSTSLIGDDDRMEALDGHFVAGPRVERAPDFGRSARSDGLDQPISGKEHGLGHDSRVAQASSEGPRSTLRRGFRTATKPAVASDRRRRRVRPRARRDAARAAGWSWPCHRWAASVSPSSTSGP
jgi:hypothetical protein